MVKWNYKSKQRTWNKFIQCTGGIIDNCTFTQRGIRMGFIISQNLKTGAIHVDLIGENKIRLQCTPTFYFMLYIAVFNNVNIIYPKKLHVQAVTIYNYFL